MVLTIYAAAMALIVILSVWWKPRALPKDHPPIIDIPAEEMFRNPRRAYESALNEHGPIIAVYRKGRLEFIVNEQFTTEVLTNDSVFSFESGTLTVLNLHPLLLLPRSFIRDIDKLVNEGLVPLMNQIIQQITPIFERNIRVLTDKAQSATSKDPAPVDLAGLVHRTMAESMLTIIFGEAYTTLADIRAAEKIASDIAVLSGIYQNIGYWSRTFPTSWRVITWIRIMAFSIPWNFIRVIGFRVWKDLRSCTKTGSTGHLRKETLLHYLVRRYSYKDAHAVRLTLLDSLWILGLTLGLLFASIHQTAAVIVWVVFELAVRPESIPILRAELQDVLEVDEHSGKLVLTNASLKNAERLDSFIREVMRTKGDTLSTIRLTLRDVTLGGYTIPKGQLVCPLATLSHRNPAYHGEDAEEFVSDRWVGQSKPAVMVSPTYWPFGLGRFACPGRALAVAEIKLAVFFLIGRAFPVLEGNKYEVVDPLNITSVPPVGRLLLQPAPPVF
ncbi:cytochrome P450 [Guyanagaster necrorhizus]|uniref:Cytochrome P450 n=1 Tax=Guyanagaster necrorhizus TaxID=856835 RepID=A0A9P7VQH4_9AGAR|nr:cytochrome P450 [Guyanagaster necrorhizus MCA 3950]KAG7444134.1 cytochrome P450 [Guyanagaster necrorhizus MCA 3950]